MIAATLARPAVERLWDAPDAVVADLVLETLAYTPVGRLEPIDYSVRRSRTEVPLFGVGHLPRLARFLTRLDRSPRLSFAGADHVSPRAEGAVTSGMRAATDVIRGL